MIDLKKYKWLDSSVSITDTSLSNKDTKRVLDALDKKDMPYIKKNVYAQYYFEQSNKRENWNLDSNLSKEFRSWSKSQSFKRCKETVLENDKGKYIMSGIVIVMTATLVLFFLKAVLTENFLVNFSIDAIVGSVALFFLARNLRIKYRMLKRSVEIRDYLYMDIASFALAALLKIMLPAVVDVSLLVFLVSYYVSKKRFDKTIHEIQF